MPVFYSVKKSPQSDTQIRRDLSLASATWQTIRCVNNMNGNHFSWGIFFHKALVSQMPVILLIKDRVFEEMVNIINWFKVIYVPDIKPSLKPPGKYNYRPNIYEAFLIESGLSFFHFQSKSTDSLQTWIFIFSTSWSFSPSNLGPLYLNILKQLKGNRIVLVKYTETCLYRTESFITR